MQGISRNMHVSTYRNMHDPIQGICTYSFRGTKATKAKNSKEYARVNLKEYAHTASEGKNARTTSAQYACVISVNSQLQINVHHSSLTCVKAPICCQRLNERDIS